MSAGAHRATLRLGFASSDDATRMAASIAPENAGFLRSRVEGAALVLDAEADAPLTLLRTLDDALACLTAAERAADLAKRE